MTITINTDASYHPVHKIGAFAFWIVWDEGRIIKNGVLKKVKNAQDAELQSIGNALFIVLESELKNLEHIYINTDCQYGIEAVTKGKKINGCLDTVKHVQKIINKLIAKHGYRKNKNKKFKKFISWRYVKAHTDGEDKRTWVNNRMDRMAKEALWDAINSKNAKQA